MAEPVEIPLVERVEVASGPGLLSPDFEMVGRFETRGSEIRISETLRTPEDAERLIEVIRIVATMLGPWPARTLTQGEEK